LRGTGIGRHRCQAIPTVLFDHQRLVQQCAAHPPEGTPWYPARVVHYSTEARRRGVLRSPFTRTSYLADEIWPAGIWACLPGYHHTRVDGRRGKDPSGGGDTQPTDLSLSEEAAWLPNRMEEDVVKLTMDFRQVGIATTLSSLMTLMVALMAASGVLALRHPEQALVARSC
jgi:hypothetical protein